MRSWLLTALLVNTLATSVGAESLQGNVSESATRVARPSDVLHPKPLSAGLSDEAFKLGAQGQADPPLESATTDSALPRPLTGTTFSTSSSNPLTGRAEDNNAKAGASGSPSAPIIDNYNAPKILSGSITLRFCYYDLGDGLDCCWEGLRDAIYLQAKGVDVAIMLDRGGVRLANKHNMHELQLHRGSTEKMIKTQQLLRDFIDKGGTVYASQRWSQTFGLIGGSYPSLTQGVKLATDEEMADLLIERNGRIVEY